MQDLNERDTANLHSLVHRLAMAKLRGLPIPLSYRALSYWHKDLASQVLRSGRIHRSHILRPVEGRKY